MADSQDTTGLSESPDLDRFETVDYATSGFLQKFDTIRDLVLNKVQHMEFEELRALFEACETLSEVLAGFCSQPRFKKEETRLGVVMNDAGSILDAFEDTLSWLSTLAANTASSKEARTPNDCGIRGEILIQHASRGDEFTEIAAVALKASLAVADAERREVRNRRSGAPGLNANGKPSAHTPVN